jgi:antitoxin component of RelBE/YafQ-DinJ toxin-antitoxin module
MKQSQKIIFRVREDMKVFVKEFAEKMGMDTSDFMRLVLEYLYLFKNR